MWWRLRFGIISFSTEEDNFGIYFRRMNRRHFFLFLFFFIIVLEFLPSTNSIYWSLPSRRDKSFSSATFCSCWTFVILCCVVGCVINVGFAERFLLIFCECSWKICEFRNTAKISGAKTGTFVWISRWKSSSWILELQKICLSVSELKDLIEYAKHRD